MLSKISIVIPCYNSEKYIERCLDSIESRAKCEIVIVDDCSSDDTVELVRQYALKSKLDINIYVNERNVGAGEARNIGIGYATKEYIMFLDSDDTIVPQFFEDLTKMELDKYDCIIFDAQQISNSTKYLRMFWNNEIQRGEVSNKEAFVYVRGCTWGKIYKKEIVDKNNVRFGSIKRNEDLIFTKVFIANSSKIYYIDKAYYNYFDNFDSLMHQNNLRTTDNAYYAYKEICSSVNNADLEQELNSLYFLEVVYSTTMTYLRLGKKMSECRKHYKEVKKKYNKDDKYRNGYILKYRLVYWLFEHNLYILIKRIIMRS